MLTVILYSVLIMLASLIGVVAIWKNIGEKIEKNMHYLISFSAGVFSIISFNLSIETIEHSNSVAYGLFWFFSGMILVWIFFKSIPFFHHHECEDDNLNTNHHHNQHKINTKKVIFGDALHNIGDGILLGSAFIISPTFGAITAISIFIHELIQEISEFFILRAGGFSIKKALKINLLTSSTILIGSIGSYILIEKFEALEIPLLGISAGVFAIVVLQDLIPHSIKNSINKTHLIKHLIWFLFGIILMYATTSYLGHGHDEGEVHNDIETEQFEN